MLSSVLAELVPGLIEINEFNIRTILDFEMRDRAIGGEKSLMVYPYMITHLCLAVEV